MTEIYQSRRKKLLDHMLPNSALLVYGVGLQEGQDTLLDRDLYYLSGYTEPPAALLLVNATKGRRQILFCSTADQMSRLWHGASASPAMAKKKLGFDEAYDLDCLREYLTNTLVGIETLYYPFGDHTSWLTSHINKLRISNVRHGNRVPQQLMDTSQLIGDMRLIKDTHEIALIKQAADISVQAHNRIAAKLPQLHYEYQVEAELLYHYRYHAAHTAFPPIVAAGKNACVLHYMKNNASIRPQDWLLVDSGAQYQYYAADITRTYPPRQPNNSAFDRVHRAVATALRLAHKTARIGLPFAELHQVVRRCLTKELIKMDIIKQSLKQALAMGEDKKFFPHQTSHWIGLDVHDAGSYSNQCLKSGMVFSIEPGLYFPPYTKTTPPKWRGIGVRLEDTVLMTPTGPQNLTAAARGSLVE